MEALKQIIEAIVNGIEMEEMEVTEFGEVSPEIVKEINGIDKESDDLKEYITAKVNEYKEERIANMKKELKAYVDHLEAKHQPEIDLLQNRQAVAWDKMRVDRNIPEEIENNHIHLRNTDGVAVVRVPK